MQPRAARQSGTTPDPHATAWCRRLAPGAPSPQQLPAGGASGSAWRPRPQLPPTGGVVGAPVNLRDPQQRDSLQLLCAPVALRHAAGDDERHVQRLRPRDESAHRRLRGALDRTRVDEPQVGTLALGVWQQPGCGGGGWGGWGGQQGGRGAVQQRAGCLPQCSADRGARGDLSARHRTCTRTLAAGRSWTRRPTCCGSTQTSSPRWTVSRARQVPPPRTAPPAWRSTLQHAGAGAGAPSQSSPLAAGPRCPPSLIP